MRKTDRRVAVIIPFYQVDGGILTRALESVYKQNLPTDLLVDVFVIDDSSPHPGHLEVPEPQPDTQIRVYMFRQSNGGPGAARNNGLERVRQAGRYDFVAFLDSDDEWMPDHLADALIALDRGYDFYFCDNGRDGAFESYSSDLDTLAYEGRAIKAKADWTQRENLLMGFPAYSLTDEMVETCLSHTSCVVLRAEMASSLRFDVDLRSAGEDHMYWINVILAGARPIISWKRNVLCGRGVNIFYGSFDWNSKSTLNRVGNLALFGEKLAMLPNLSPRNIEVAKRTREKYRRAYAFLLMRALLKRQDVALSAYHKLRKYDAFYPFRIPFLAMSLIISRDPSAMTF